MDSGGYPATNISVCSMVQLGSKDSRVELFCTRDALDISFTNSITFMKFSLFTCYCIWHYGYTEKKKKMTMMTRIACKETRLSSCTFSGPGTMLISLSWSVQSFAYL